MVIECIRANNGFKVGDVCEVFVKEIKVIHFLNIEQTDDVMRILCCTPTHEESEIAVATLVGTNYDENNINCWYIDPEFKENFIIKE